MHMKPITLLTLTATPISSLAIPSPSPSATSAPPPSPTTTSHSHLHTFTPADPQTGRGGTLTKRGPLSLSSIIDAINRARPPEHPQEPRITLKPYGPPPPPTNIDPADLEKLRELGGAKNAAAAAAPGVTSVVIREPGGGGVTEDIRTKTAGFEGHQRKKIIIRL